MNHTITIKNLGPLKDIEDFEIKDINIIIGESASGKSILATAIFFFNEFFGMRQIDARDTIESIKKQMLSDIAKTFTPYSQYYIKYSFSKNSYIEINVHDSPKLAKIIFSEKFEGEIGKTIKEINTAYKSRQATRTIAQLERILEEVESASKDNIEEIKKLVKANTDVVAPFKIYEKYMDILKIHKTYFIPAIRSAYIDSPRLNTLSNRSFSRSYTGRYIRKEIEEDPKLINFLYLYSKAHEDFTSVPDEHKKIIKGDLIPNDGEVKLKIPNDKQQLDLEYLSSGQKATIPILLILNYLAESNTKCLLIIEEPEAHIFPTAQREIFDEIVKFVNVTGSKILITTHSPYTILSANNLLEAHGRNLEAHGGKLSDYQGKTIGLERLSAAKLENGKFESLINDEYNLISGEYLENVNEKIMLDFNIIIEAEHSKGIVS